MNTRIKVTDDTEISIQRNSSINCASKYWTRGADLRVGGTETWDAQGRDALLEALTCLRDTGSFAALSSDSAVPFVGKRMRVRGFGGEIVIVCKGRSPTTWDARSETEGNMLDIDVNDLRPLTPPAPRIRAFDYRAACEYFGDNGEFPITNGIETCSVCAVGLSGFYTTARTWIRFDEAVKWELAGGEPCGIVEPPDA